jgi:hypothetical protein
MLSQAIVSLRPAALLCVLCALAVTCIAILPTSDNLTRQNLFAKLLWLELGQNFPHKNSED